jgi:hypothetical protein
MIRRLFLPAVVAALGAAAYIAWPDVARYIKIREM